MRTLFIPSTTLGRLATALLLLFIVLMALKVAGDPPVGIPVSIFAIFGLGFVAGMLALTSVVRAHERSLWVFLAIVVGLLLAIWTAGELLFPH